MDAADRKSRAILAFRAANAEDPEQLLVAGEARPKQLVEAERLATWVIRLESTPSEALELASHCQHLRRWTLPRSAYPEGRIGYLSWRKALARLHAEQATSILRSVGYDETLVEQVRRINLKQGLRLDPEVQTMEDALCLSFLEHELEEFAQKHDDAKLIDIIRKTWAKMSERGHARALELAPALPSRSAELVTRALAPDAS